MGLDRAYARGNDAIALAAERAGVAEGPVDFICECTNDECFDRVPLTLSQYRGLRANGAAAVVIEDHEPRG